MSDPLELISIVDRRWSLFVKVTELGSLSHAAAVLNTTQSIVSRQIGALERDCGTRLFRRTGRGVVLTEVGQQIFPRIKGLVAQAERLADDIRTSNGEAAGEVRLGILPSTVSTLAGDLYRETIRRFPKVRLHLTEGSSVQLEDWLNQGRLDLSLLLREDDIERPSETTLTRVSLSLIGRQQDRLLERSEVEFDQLAGLPLVLPGEPHLLRARLALLAAQRNVKLNIAVEADSVGLQKAIVRAGGGYAITATPSELPTASMPLRAALIVNPKLSRRVVLSTTLLRPLTHAIRAVSETIADEFARASRQPGS
jgi:DNA-binding transcriptional LysR family regulator